jgi:hypothetical protein
MPPITFLLAHIKALRARGRQAPPTTHWQ